MGEGPDAALTAEREFAAVAGAFRLTIPIVDAAVEVVRRETRLAEAEHRVRRPVVPDPTPGRPAWWDLMSPEARALAEACEAAGLWRVEEVGR